MPRLQDPPAGARDTADRTEALRALWAAPARSAGFLGRAWAAAFAVEASLRVLGYQRTLSWIERVPRRRAPGPGTPPALGERLVRGAYRAHLFDGGCLPRSLVQYLLHRRDGTPARFVVGVRRAAEARSTAGECEAGRRIEAHAWVESPGAPRASAAPGFSAIFQSGAPADQP